MVIKWFMKLFNKKLADREKILDSTLSAIRARKNGEKRIWFHSSSMGEFEQAKPVIEELKERYPDIYIIVSFFSPSGYNNQKNYPFADAITYMPFDVKSSAKQYISLVDPDLVIFVRYEIWRNYLESLYKKNIPPYLICATKPGSALLRNYPVFMQFTKSNYNFFSSIFTVGKEHSDYFESLNINAKIETLSDTRFDRIKKTIEEGGRKDFIDPELFEQDEFVLVLGSCWQPDEDIIFPSVDNINKDKFRLRMLIVPHEPTGEHLANIKSKYNDIILLSELIELLGRGEKPSGSQANRHIVVDSVGKLLSLYKYADLAYIGGAFGAGVHSVTEPAGYGIPLSCGDSYHNSPDAIELVKQNALTAVKDEHDFLQWLNDMIESKERREKTGIIAKNYVYGSVGSSEKIVEKIKERISL